MRVLLLEPQKIPWAMMGNVIAPPFGLAQLAGCLEAAGIPVEILDANALKIPPKRLGATIARSEPDLVGITAHTSYMVEVIHAAQIARQAAPGAVIAMGGPHVTFAPDETLNVVPEVDVVARGEGDRILVDLAQAVASGEGWEGVAGLSFRRNGAVVHNEPPPVVDVTKLPMPAFHLMPMDRYVWPVLGGPFATIVTSRGCPFRCNFCAEWPFWRNGWRAYDAEQVVDQIDELVNRYGRRNLWFGDDCFNVNREHIAGICEEILRRGIEVGWFCQGRADMLVRDKDLMPLFHRAGMRMMQVGIEASQDEQRDELNKQLGTETVEEAVRLLQEYDVVCQGMMIVGAPSDSRKTIEHKVRFIKRLGIDFPVFTIYTPFPGTPAFEEAAKQKWINFPQDYGRFDMTHAVLPTEHLTRREVLNYTAWAFSNVYLNPVRFAKHLLSKNPWRRRTYWSMLVYIGKQLLKAFPRI
jgi:anaerobic magnesium-protoporphyrin IX monomethyl ester cyclase